LFKKPPSLLVASVFERPYKLNYTRYYDRAELISREFGLNRLIAKFVKSDTIIKKKKNPRLLTKAFKINPFVGKHEAIGVCSNKHIIFFVENFIWDIFLYFPYFI